LSLFLHLPRSLDLGLSSRGEGNPQLAHLWTASKHGPVKHR
jgi:hypothetical protein